ncbi:MULTISPECIES: TonB-dependent receptor [Brevundimonas]|jgi:outer membrane receptor protein involved in Fe transport|uniref:Outer membrane receptor protein involved in Fe transport n=1 Tax=Brevundimonas aurantiaca TaxID=74316 RepID=A0A7W9C864_9CAUL|nr:MULTISPECIES: TonB-dependent receptor [Brevundimonas]MBB5740797.1 outer membrane receptor protein involved in Fe transport [Brevundimonas aurantiaca]MDM8354280.1 TonB-dependent receptor [Brevundimonas diminuta]
MSRFSLLCGVAAVASVVAVSTTACAQTARDFNIPAGSMRSALTAFATQSDQQIFFTSDLVDGLRSPGVTGRMEPGIALDRLLRNSGLTWTQSRQGVFAVQRTGVASDEGQATEIDDVVVTGTLLRSAGSLASPVIQLDRDELDSRGQGTVADILVALPQNYAGTSTPVTQATLADAGTSNDVFSTGVNLRGLGAASTLVLVNGRRLAGTGSRAEFADVSALPSAAVERVDVLLDGASALYGSDAVAGVVNVIMRRAFDGQESRARIAAAEGGAEDVQVSHLLGRTWTSGAAYVSYEYQNTKALNASDRRYTADGDLRPFGGSDHRSFYSAPGNILAFDPSASAYAVQFAIRPNASGVAQGPADFAQGEANLQSSLLGIDLLPALERHSVYGRVRQSIGDRLELSADVRYSRRRTESATAAAAGIFNVTQANPWFVSPSGAPSHTIAYSFFRDLGPARSFATSESLGVTLGARYDLTDDWSVETYFADARELADFGLRNRVNTRFFAEALGNIPDDPTTPFRAAVDGYFNLFGNGTTNPRAVLDFVGSGYGDVHNQSGARSANVLVQGPVRRLPGGDLSIALGAQVREESFETQGETFLTAAVPRLMASPKQERVISAVFAEARIPIIGPDNAIDGVRRLEVSVAARAEEYDDFGSTTNPKVGLAWSPVDRLTVRSSWGTSFRAAALSQLFDQFGVSPAFLDRADGSEALILMLYGGNTDLKPETAETFTIGFDYRPVKGPTLSLNYFDTRFSDRIAQPVNANFDGALIDATLRPFVTFIDPANNAADRALIESYASSPGFSGLFPVTAYGAVVDTRWVNTGAVRVRGLDVQARHDWSVGGGTLSVDSAASWILDYESRTTPTAPSEQVAGLVGYPVDFRARTGATWSRDEFQIGAHWNYVTDTRDRRGSRIASWNTIDAIVSWTPDWQAASGLQVQLAVQNLLNEDPPFYDATTGLGFDPGQANLMGRVLSLQLIRRW